ncbi:hypothetical protein [Oceanospirillum maris]|uniref:hypothetical protein n=1 Tax=Oceanospirillum maris TaxID=64977 RepID=UPI0003F7F6BC|nr:hypothetical protein [Oceanospirillum maris]
MVNLLQMGVLRVVCVLVFTLCSSIGYADSIADDVRDVVEENIAAIQNENMARMMKTVHSSSPSYQATMQQVPSLFQQYDLEYELTGYDFVGVTGEFAVAKVRQITRKVGGSAAFNDNELELLQAFRKEDGQWKFWSQSVLNMNFFGQ